MPPPIHDFQESIAIAPRDTALQVQLRKHFDTTELYLPGKCPLVDKTYDLVN